MRRDRLDPQSRGLHSGEVAGNRPPNHGDVYLAGADGFDYARRRIGNRIVPIDREAAQLADDAAMAQCVGWRRIGPVVADQLDADP